mmetsp:Transcript_8177/g.15389  ORF Transcript_8177/g.15389 Transcript_8177/m.15389 type:complete len:502 (+) Transcript_8177:127-1632(+)
MHLSVSSYLSTLIALSALNSLNSLNFSRSIGYPLSKSSTSYTFRNSLKMSSQHNEITKAPPKPKPPLPKPLLSLIPGTWAYDTMSRRIDSEILERTFQENNDEFLNNPAFSSAFEKFQALRSELQSASTSPLRHLHPLPEHMKNDPVALREYNEWEHILSPFVNKDVPDTWLSAPWMVAEFYLYRRLMETLDYFNPNSPTYLFDPFAKQKYSGLETSVATAEPILAQVRDSGKKNLREGFALSAAFALWGNKMDLSIWPADSKENNAPELFQKILASANENLLHDDTDVLVDYGQKLYDKGGGNVDIVVDNAGFELIMDLALADYLIDSGIAKTVRFQLKSHPTFVSDALEKDLRQHVQYYCDLDPEKFSSSKMVGKRWQTYLDTGSWVCNENSFWVQPPPMWEMPHDLRNDLKERCDLAFIKGDANYRRLVGDLEWDFSTPFEDVVGHYFPCPVCALRTLKAEVGCGMEKEKVENAKEIDKNWCTNGRFGVVHFSMGSQE